jgi:YfiH family protein
MTPFTHPTLTHPGIGHGFFGREGGVSEGIYAGLNCGVGSRDNAEHVAENRRRVAQHFGLPASQLCTLYQIHSAEVVTLTAPVDPANKPQADAMVTATPGIALGILTADCGPVLFADPIARVIGAAHAGWKGAVGGVLEATLRAMQSLGARAENIHAVLGPTIAQASYEVGTEFFERFSGLEQKTFFIPSGREGHHYFDLPAYITTRLAAAGLAKVGNLAMDTNAREADFFSYRRTTLRGEADYGRQVSVITLREESL